MPKYSFMTLEDMLIAIQDFPKKNIKLREQADGIIVTYTHNGSTYETIIIKETEMDIIYISTDLETQGYRVRMEV